MAKLHAQTLGDFPSDRFKLSGHCLSCGARSDINQDKFPDMSFSDFRENAHCPVCLEKGLSISITIRKKIAETSEA